MIEQVSDRLPSRELSDRTKRRIGIAGLALLAAAFAMTPASAQSGDAICDTQLWTFATSVVGTIFRIGPVLGLASGALSMVMMSQSTAKDKKKKWKQRRNDSFIYGVVGVLLSGYIVEFLFTLTGQDTNCGESFTTFAVVPYDGAMALLTAVPF